MNLKDLEKETEELREKVLKTNTVLIVFGTLLILLYIFIAYIQFKRSMILQGHIVCLICMPLTIFAVGSAIKRRKNLIHSKDKRNK